MALTRQVRDALFPRLLKRTASVHCGRAGRSSASFQWSATAILIGLGVALQAQESKADGAESDPLAILEAHCVKCHGGEKTKAGLDLTTRDLLLRGGESGPAIDRGKPESSLLYRMVAQLEEPGMPNKEDPLPPELIAQIADWIRAGVPYSHPLKKAPPDPASASSARTEFAITDTDRAHWAFQPLKPIAAPAVRNTSWPKTPIDRFILAALETKDLAPAPAAAAETLIRRITLDLIGLPPTPAEIDAFMRDSTRDPQSAVRTLVDRLLASPHYGERWGRHWLDLVRFAESDGFEHDAARPHAWRYRDYVVRAFNTDKPYDRFIREQIAGDELFPSEPDAQIATAFNLLGPDMTDSADQVQRRRNTLNDMTDTTAFAFLGLTLGCARCHDHKFEPFSQRDYYSLQAFFTSAKFRTDLSVPTPDERAAYDAATKAYNEQTSTIQERIAAIEEPCRKRLFEERLATLSPEAQLAHRTPKEQRTTEQENQVQETASLVEITEKALLAALTKSERDRHKLLLDQLKPFPKPKPLPATLALQDGPPAKTQVLFRGDYTQPGEEVTAGFPEVLDGVSRRKGTRAPAAAHLDASGLKSPPAPSQRAPLAEWIASPQNPLSARVLVNRVWQHHFGRGLVPTPSDFGTHGQKPTHPELLDWLASEFISSGWSIKQLHRLILQSAVYQQSTVADPPTIARDPENRFYSRMSRLRLEGEAIRDSLLAISGDLNPKLGGPSVFPPIPKEVFAGAKGWTPSENPRDYTRRSVYIFVRRNLRFPFLEVFDAPDNNLSCPIRERSTTAPQSLTLLNADEVLVAAEHTAQRLTAATDSVDSRVALAYRLVLGRLPTEKERTLALAFLAHSPLNEFCRALFNLNAFVYVE